MWFVDWGSWFKSTFGMQYKCTIEFVMRAYVFMLNQLQIWNIRDEHFDKFQLLEVAIHYIFVVVNCTKISHQLKFPQGQTWQKLFPHFACMHVERIHNECLNYEMKNRWCISLNTVLSHFYWFNVSPHKRTAIGGTWLQFIGGYKPASKFFPSWFSMQVDGVTGVQW